MSRLQRKLSPFLSATLTHPRTRDARRRLVELGRRVRGAPHRVLYFHQVDDPYGHLVAQVLGELVARYEVVLEPHLVGPPPNDAAPEPERLEAFARKDAADVAPFYGLDFPEAATRPAPESVELATRLLAGAIGAGRFEKHAARIGDALRERRPVEIVWRPVLPMVMRGLPVPTAKRLYILFDTKREAELIGEPFGHVCDPVGRPVERGLSLWPFARAQGREGEYLHAFTRAAFAEGVDTGTDAGLRHVVEEAGLAWDDARPHLGGEGWREEVEENRRVLMKSGLWGVPSFRLLGGGDEPDFSTWGQDRLWLVEEILRRRVAPTDPSGDTRSAI